MNELEELIKFKEFELNEMKKLVESKQLENLKMYHETKAYLENSSLKVKDKNIFLSMLEKTFKHND